MHLAADSRNIGVRDTRLWHTTAQTRCLRWRTSRRKLGSIGLRSRETPWPAHDRENARTRQQARRTTNTMGRSGGKCENAAAARMHLTEDACACVVSVQRTMYGGTDAHASFRALFFPSSVDSDMLLPTGDHAFAGVYASRQCAHRINFARRPKDHLELHSSGKKAER